MSDADDVLIRRQTLGEQVLSLTSEQLFDFVENKELSRACEACGSTTWHLAQDAGLPTITSTTNVRSPDTSSWFFFVSCQDCANTRFLEAGIVWDHFFGKSKDATE